MFELKQLSAKLSVLPLSQMRHLSLSSTLQELSLYDFQIESECPGREVAQAFKSNPLLPGVILTEQGELLGMISRRLFLEDISRPYGRELFLKRPVKCLYILANTEVLSLPKETLIFEAYRQCLQRTAAQLDEPIVVEIEPKVYRLLDIHQLLVAQSHIHELTTQLLNRQILVEKNTLEQLRKEIAERVGAESALKQAKQELESRVEERTAQLTDSEQRFRFLAEIIPQQVWTAQPDGRLDYVNQRVLDYFRRTKKQMLGAGWQEVIHPEDVPRCLERWNKSLATGEPYEVEFRLFRAADKTYRWHIGRALPRHDEEGRLVSWFGTSTDIHEQKQTEADLQLANEQLEIKVQERTAELRKALEKEKDLSELKNRFFSMASHDFRTPLTTILTSSDLLKLFSHKFSEDKKQQHLMRIQTAVKNMTLLLDDVLFIGKVESGRMEFNPVPLNLEEFCQEVLSDISLTDDKNHVLNFECHGDCSLVDMDQKLLRKMLANLLSNAVKYSPEASTVRLNVLCENQQAIINVQDQGIGIPESEQLRLFEVFHRCSNVGNISGTGLGMAIIKQAVELHGGSISFESVAGVGTTFTVCVPTIQQQKAQ